MTFPSFQDILGIPFYKMKQLLLHGSAINNSRTKLSEIRQKFDANNVIVFEKGSEVFEIAGSLMTSSLLPEEKLFILENPDETFINYPLNPNLYTLILWFDHEVADKKPIMEWAKKSGQILFFPESKEASVFPFLDYLANQEHKAFFEIKKLKSNGFDIFYIITMTYYLLRNLISTPKTAPEFVRQKLDRQRKNFDLEKITKLYQDILEIEFKLKSGLLEKPQAEFLLVSKFTDLGY